MSNSIQTTNFNTCNLLFGNIIQSMYRYPTFYNINYVESGIPVIKGENISRIGEWQKLEDISYIDYETDQKFLKTKLALNDLVMTVRGEVGKVGLVENTIINSNMSGNLIKISLKESFDETQIIPRYIWEFLNSFLGKANIQKHISGAVHETITTAAIKDIEVFLPAENIQKSICDFMRMSRKKHIKKLDKANTLLTEIDEIVLAKLNITPSKESSLSYIVKLAEIENRFDAVYYKTSFKSLRDNIIHCKHPVLKIKDIYSQMKAGFAAGKQDQTKNSDDGIVQIRPFNISPNGELVFDTKKCVPEDNLKEVDLCKQGEVLFNNTNSAKWVGKSTVFDANIPCAASNHITRLTLKSGISPYYIAAVFNAFRSIGYWDLLSTYFNNQAGINSITLDEVLIPIPDIKIQNNIANEINCLKVQSQKLRIEAEKKWQDARRQFEKMLLGE